ncbi:MAG: nucleoside hydrolase [Planctomycetota bacterium]
MSQKIIIDSDPGIADSLAILVALADPAVEVIGLTATAGAVSGIQATRNLQYLINRVDPIRHPRIGQSDMASAPCDDAPVGMPHPQHLNGRSGLGDLDPLVPDLHNRRESARLIVDLVREFPNEVRILTFGPLTNLAMALELDAELPMLMSGLICLGGVLTQCGDVTAAAEFNFWSDPAAAQTVMRSPVGKIVVPLDVSHGPALAFDDIDRLSGLIPSTPVGEMINGLMLFAVRASRQHTPSETLAIPAVTALAVASRSADYQADAVVMDVETEGELTSGMTIVDRRPCRPRQTNAEVITQLDDAAVLDYFCRGVRRIAVSSEGASD